MDRHFTVTGFVCYRGATVLHWHRKLSMWLPPGGHIEPNEDPIQAVMREVREETGLTVEVLLGRPRLEIERPMQIPAPATILIEDIPEPGHLHQHIDLIYYCRVIGTRDLISNEGDTSLLWVEEAALLASGGILSRGNGTSAEVPEDVRLLALDAIAIERLSTTSMPRWP